MKCEWVKENVLLYVYNELPDDARYELEQHLARCADCSAELKTTRKFHALLSELPVEEPFFISKSSRGVYMGSGKRSLSRQPFLVEA